MTVTTIDMEPDIKQEKLCNRCTINSRAVIELRKVRRFKTVLMHDSFAALESFAYAGCDLCRLLRQGLIYSAASPAEYEALQHSSQSVVLWYSVANTFQKGIFPPSSRDNFVVSCSVYPKWHRSLIPFLVGPKDGGEKQAGPSDVEERPTFPLDSSTENSKTSMQATEGLIAGWIDACDRSHVSCGIRGERPNLPTRVIDIGHSGVLRLIITKELSADLRSQPYSALSHCWGASAHHLVTKRANLKQVVQGIKETDMPQTYLDAFQITRNLGLRYIWIDALCIIQDDRDDWQVESARMCNIYRDAYFTIAATAAESNGQGCFMEKYGSSLPTHACRLAFEEGTHSSEIVLLPPTPSWQNQILSSPLNSRAWVLQERLLSRRTLHFAKDAIFWECSEMKSSQFEPDGIADAELMAGPVSYTYSLRSLTAAECSQGAWLQLVQHFSKLGITKLEDKLPALSGLAKMIQAQTNDIYMAGLWKSSLVEGLSWSLSGKDFKFDELEYKRSYIGPSWSWASTDRELGFLTLTGTASLTGSAKGAADQTWKSDVKVLNISVQPAGLDPTGQVLGGSITLSGYKDSLHVVNTRSLPAGNTESIDPGNLERRLQQGIEAKGSANLIHLDYPKDPSIASFPALRLCHRGSNNKTQTCLLVLEATGKHLDQYRRIGRAVLYGLVPVAESDKRVIELI